MGAAIDITKSLVRAHEEFQLERLDMKEAVWPFAIQPLAESASGKGKQTFASETLVVQRSRRGGEVFPRMPG